MFNKSLHYCRLRVLILVISSIVVVAGVMVSHNAFALTVSPPRIDLEMFRGSSETKNIRVFNESLESVLITPELADISFLENEASPQVTGLSENSSFSKLLLFQPDVLKLEPGEVIDFPFTIKIPLIIEPGGYYGALLFSGMSEEKVEKGNIGIIGKTGPLVFITVAGDISAKAELIEFSFNDQFKTEKLVFGQIPESYKIKVQNNGKIHVVPQGIIEISNWRGRVYEKFDVNSSDRVVLPGWTRNLEISADQTVQYSSGLKKEWQRFGFGRYTATLSLDLGKGVVQDKLVFWVIPWRTGSVVLVTILLLILGFYLRGRRGLSPNTLLE